MANDILKSTLCIVVKSIPGHCLQFDSFVGENGFKKFILCHENVSKVLKEVKHSGDSIVLLITGPIGYDAIKFLCDDWDAPETKRRVKWIHSLSSGLDAYNLPSLEKEVSGIPITNARGCYSSILAEHVIYSMLYFNRKTWRLQESRAARKWDPFDMMELRGQKIGIIGYGDIGVATGKLAAAFGMDVTGVKRTKPSAAVDAQGVKLVHGDAERDRVIRESDFVVGVLPGTEETKQFFNKDRFAMMKPSAVYINIGRGITQCEDDLVDALRRNVIRGAAVDVFQKEPLPAESALWEIGDEKLLFSPHSADRSADLVPSSVRRFIAFVEEYLKSGELKAYRVDIKKGY